MPMLKSFFHSFGCLPRARWQVIYQYRVMVCPSTDVLLRPAKVLSAIIVTKQSKLHVYMFLFLLFIHI